jgi:wobble nucleotide-excising tRNase
VFFTSYKDKVNHYLQAIFKTPLRIENVVHIPPVGRANYNKLGYKLTINGQELSFDPNGPHGVRESLSEGDRSTLALAFFLAKLDLEPSLASKILVFDDPLSSFDSNRRLETIGRIQQLLPAIKQIVVLSHNEFFLAELAKNVAAADKKALRIAEDFTTHAAYIEPLDLEAMVENEYFKQIKELEDFRHTPDITKRDHIVGLLRTVLEAHLRFKFYRYLTDLPVDQQTLGKIIDSIDRKGVTFRDNATRPGILSKMQLIRAISCKPHHGEPMPVAGSLPFGPTSISSTQLDSLIVDLFHLVDVQL